MRKYTQRQIRNMVASGEAEPLDGLGFEKLKSLKKSLVKVGYSIGTMGINAGLMQDSEGNLFAITGRNSALHYFF